MNTLSLTEASIGLPVKVYVLVFLWISSTLVKAHPMLNIRSYRTQIGDDLKHVTSVQ